MFHCFIDESQETSVSSCMLLILMDSDTPKCLMVMTAYHKCLKIALPLIQVIMRLSTAHHAYQNRIS